MSSDQIPLSFPRLDLKQNRIQSGVTARYPMFNSSELEVLNKQNDITQTDMKGSGLKKNITKVVSNHHIARQTKNTLKNKVLPVVKKHAIKLAKNEIKSMLDTDTVQGGKFRIKKHIHSVSKSLKKNHVGRKALNTAKTHVLPVAKEIAKEGLKDTATALAESNPELLPLLPVANVAIDKAIGSGIKKPNARAQIVKQVMKQSGLSMIDASKFVINNFLLI